MRPPSALVLLLLLFLACQLSADQRGDFPDAPHLSPEKELAGFHVPPGFEVQLVAAEPEIAKPLNLAFDAAGRLWVTCTEIYPWAARTDALGQPIRGFGDAWKEMAAYFRVPQTGDGAPQPPERGRDTVRMLSDFGPDGRARKVQTFADGLNIPIGMQPLPRTPGSRGDSILVHSIPAIWRLTDTDGDGIADQREPLYRSFGYKDTHGMSSNYLYWVDGWVYGCHGYANHSEVTDRQGRTTILDSGNTYRFRPDGTQFEIYSHGQTNPFGLAADDLGDFYTCDSHSRPAMLVLPGGYYEGINKQHDGLGFAPRIMEHDHGSSAIAGLAWYGASQFPPEYRGNTFNGNPVTRRINRDRYQWSGSSPSAVEMPDFLTSDDPCFRPVQVVLGPDGALYVADFYNSIIGHYEHPLADTRRDRSSGRIWRIRWRGGGTPAPMPDLTRLDAAGLLAHLGRESTVLARLAVNELAERIGPGAAPAVLAFRNDPQQPAGARALAGCILDRWGQASGVQSPHPLELRRLGEKPTWSDSERAFVEAALAAASPDPRVLRAAVLAAGRHPQGLLRQLAALERRTQGDPQLAYSIRLALRSALSQPGGFDEAEALLGSQAAGDPIAQTALAIPTAEAARALLGYLVRVELRPERAPELLQHAVRYLGPGELPRLSEAATVLQSLELSQAVPFAASLASALSARSGTNESGIPGALLSWMESTLSAGTNSPDAGMALTALTALRFVPGEWKAGPLHAVLHDSARSLKLRAAALDAFAGSAAAMGEYRAILADPAQGSLRVKAASLLGQRREDQEARSALLDALPTAPFDLATELATALSDTDAGAAALCEAIEAHRAPARLLRQRAVSRAIGRRPAALVARVEALTRALPPEDTRLDGVIAARARAYADAKPDAVHGAQVFASTCAACHRIHGQGGLIGPTLDGIRSRGVARLVEDILDPNRNVDPLFHQVLIETRDGRTLAGLGLRESAGRLSFTDATGQVQSLSLEDVKTQMKIPLSLMPPGFETLIPERDFVDLLGYLLAE